MSEPDNFPFGSVQPIQRQMQRTYHSTVAVGNCSSVRTNAALQSKLRKTHAFPSLTASMRTSFFFFASASVVRRVWGTYVSRTSSALTEKYRKKTWQLRKTKESYEKLEKKLNILFFLFFFPRTFFPKKSCTRSQCTNYGGRKVHEVQGDSAARRQAAGERGRKCLVRSPEKVTQVQGVPINVGSVREGEGEETRCESTGGCEG